MVQAEARAAAAEQEAADAILCGAWSPTASPGRTVQVRTMFFAVLHLTLTVATYQKA
jgi:hypothetical protein